MLFLLRLLALALFIYSVSLVFTSNFNMGNLLVWLLTAAVDVYAIWQQPIHHWLHGTTPGKIVFGELCHTGKVLPGVLHKISPCFGFCDNLRTHFYMPDIVR